MEPRAARRRRARGRARGARAPGSATPSAGESPTRSPAAAPERVDRLVLLDPAIQIPPHVGLAAAENARRDRSYVSFAEGIDRRYEESVLTTAPRELVEEELRVHLLEDDDGRYRYRYCQSTVVAAYGEMTREPPPFEHVRDSDAARPRRHVVPPVRRPARRAQGCARRPARGRRHRRAGTPCCGTRSTTPLRAVERFLSLGGDRGRARLDGRGERVDDSAELQQELRVDAVLRAARRPSRPRRCPRAFARRARRAPSGSPPPPRRRRTCRCSTRARQPACCAPATRRAGATPSRARS